MKPEEEWALNDFKKGLTEDQIKVFDSLIEDATQRGYNSGYDQGYETGYECGRND